MRLYWNPFTFIAFVALVAGLFFAFYRPAHRHEALYGIKNS